MHIIPQSAHAASTVAQWLPQAQSPARCPSSAKSFASAEHRAEHDQRHGDDQARSPCRLDFGTAPLPSSGDQRGRGPVRGEEGSFVAERGACRSGSLPVCSRPLAPPARGWDHRSAPPCAASPLPKSGRWPPSGSSRSLWSRSASNRSWLSRFSTTYRFIFEHDASSSSTGAQEPRVPAPASAPLLGRADNASRFQRQAATTLTVRSALGPADQYASCALPISEPRGGRSRRVSGTRTRSSTASPLAIAESVEAR